MDYIIGENKRNSNSPSITTHEQILDEQFKAADDELLIKIATHVERNYPGHGWNIGVSHADGLVRINIPLFMGSVRFYVIKIRELQTDPSLLMVTKACGEILERLNLPRSGFSASDFVDLVNNSPVGRGSTYGTKTFDSS